MVVTGGDPTATFFQKYGAHPSIRMLRILYAVVDEGNAVALEAEQARGRRPACTKGCTHCCRDQYIPMTAAEMEGMMMYAAAELHEPVRSRVVHNIPDQGMSETCPFLVDDVCSIYPMRPMACRRYYVLELACGPQEDVLLTRPNHILQPLAEYTHKAFSILYRHYGITDEQALQEALDNKLITRICTSLHQTDWRPMRKLLQQPPGAL